MSEQGKYMLDRSSFFLKQSLYKNIGFHFFVTCEQFLVIIALVDKDISLSTNIIER